MLFEGLRNEELDFCVVLPVMQFIYISKAARVNDTSNGQVHVHCWIKRVVDSIRVVLFGLGFGLAELAHKCQSDLVGG
jgi:hypothetical protein